MKCPKCNQNIPNRSKMCPRCGADIKAIIWAFLEKNNNPKSFMDVLSVATLLPEGWEDIIYSPEEKAKLDKMAAELEQVKRRNGNEPIFQNTSHAVSAVSTKPLQAGVSGSVETARAKEREAVSKMGARVAWLFVIVGGATWTLSKTTSIVDNIYPLIVEPYYLWMINPHVDSPLNLLLQVCVWLTVAPAVLCILLVCLPAIITAILIVNGTGWLMSRAGWSLQGMLFGLGGMLGSLMLVVFPLVVFGKTVKPMTALVFTGYAICHEFVKNKIFRLGKLSLGWWMFVTHIVIPAALILLVYFFAADESHIRNGRNIYSAEMQRGN